MSCRASLARLLSDSGLLDSSCIHCWQLKDSLTEKGPGGLLFSFSSFFLLLSILHASWLSILTDNPVTEDFYTCKRQPGFHPYLRDLIPNRQKFSFHDPISLNPFPSAQAVARHPSCKISWGRSIGPRWTGSRQLTSQNSCRGTTRCWKHPDSAATWKLVVMSPEGKSQTVTLELPALRTDK